MTEENWIDLPDDVEQAFLVLEERLWANVVKAHTPLAEKTYVANIKGYIDESSIDLDVGLYVDDEDVWESYFSQFHIKVEYFKARLRTRAKMVFMAKPSEIVRLSEDYREEIHNLMNRVRIIVHASDLEQPKKDAILQKVNELNNEVDQSTTKLGRFLALWREVTNAVGEGAKNLEPAVNILERVGGIFGKARAETDPAQLAAPETPKQLSGPAEEGE